MFGRKIVNSLCAKSSIVSDILEVQIDFDTSSDEPKNAKSITNAIFERKYWASLISCSHENGRRAYSHSIWIVRIDRCRRSGFFGPTSIVSEGVTIYGFAFSALFFAHKVLNWNSKFCARASSESSESEFPPYLWNTPSTSMASGTSTSEASSTFRAVKVRIHSLPEGVCRVDYREVWSSRPHHCFRNTSPT